MRYYTKRISIITVEVVCMNTEQILNGLWNNGIKSNKIKKIDAVTFHMDIYGDDYGDLKKIVKRCNGKVKIINRKGKIINISKLKKKLTFTIGGVIFVLILFVLSTRIWAIDIYTEKNVSPFEIRKILNEFGIKQGIGKSEIDVYSLEKKLEDIHDEILWVRARVEGSTLKVKIEEKVNPPDFLENENKEILAKKDGEVKRVYTQFGTAAVSPGDMVKKGDILIYPYDGLLEEKYEVKPEGTVIANVFYERSLEVQINGERLVKKGNKETDLYLNLWGKKIYLKKATNSFENYDKIEDNTGIIRSTTYYEMEEEKIHLDKDTVVKDSLKKLESLLLKDLSNEAKIVKRSHKVENTSDEKIQITAQFVVEENIT
ncbi:sporulation protein YqfD [Clostridium sp. Ade.TY]|uniref:sporulation protein YqfD n=1 Tax=Clostridium sp. Ade.TY TaxID=1391647 RepID=UPI00040C21C4|nr:sporulation protein YqfD [Clostridium sp. Ade.TY]